MACAARGWVSPSRADAIGLFDLFARNRSVGLAGVGIGCRKDLYLFLLRLFGLAITAVFSFGHGVESPERCRIGRMPDGSWLSEDHGCLRGFQGDDPFGCGRLGLLQRNVSVCREWCKWRVGGAIRFGFAGGTSCGRCECRRRGAPEGI